LASQPTFAKKERAPLVALLEIDKRLRELNINIEDQVEDATDNTTILLRYFAEFGHKGCVRDDVLPYLRLNEGKLSPEVQDLLQNTIAAEAVRSQYKPHDNV
jgi:hypothetical protein